MKELYLFQERWTCYFAMLHCKRSSFYIHVILSDDTPALYTFDAYPQTVAAPIFNRPQVATLMPDDAPI